MTTTLPTRRRRRDDAMAWAAQGACNDFADIFEATYGSGDPGKPNRDQLRAIRQAKQVCKVCPVLGQCRTHALENHEAWGVWGGLSAGQRHRILHPDKHPAASTRPVVLDSTVVRQDVLTRYQTGEPMHAIAAAYNLTVDKVRSWLVAGGVDVRGRGGRPPQSRVGVVNDPPAASVHEPQADEGHPTRPAPFWSAGVPATPTPPIREAHQ